MFENLADVAGRQNKAVCASVRQFYEKHCNWKLSESFDQVLNCRGNYFSNGGYDVLPMV